MLSPECDGGKAARRRLVLVAVDVWVIEPEEVDVPWLVKYRIVPRAPSGTDAR